MKKMLKKGDALAPQYADFDFETLDSQQQQWLSHLGIFTRYRSRIESYFREIHVSNEMKQVYLSQHSMKLGDRVFYDIEAARQVYLQSFESVPTFGVIIGLGFFCIAAHRTPLTSKLYKETAISMLLGVSIAMLHPMYTRRLYF